jgi:hypothetical protein
VKIYFDNPEFDGQFLRPLDYAPLGAQIGEGWAIAAQIHPGDTTSWYNAWSSYADRLYQLAIKSNAAGHRVSARATHSCAHRITIEPPTFSCSRCLSIRVSSELSR